MFGKLLYTVEQPYIKTFKNLERKLIHVSESSSLKICSFVPEASNLAIQKQICDG